MKTQTRNQYQFSCDGCGAVVTRHANEQEALKQARVYARANGWKWDHPGWQLRCPECQANGAD